MLTTLDFAKLYLSIDENDTEHDQVLEKFLKATTAKVRRRLGRNLEYAEHTENLNGSGRDSLRLPHYPIVELLSVNIDAGLQFADSTLLNLNTISVQENGTLVFKSSATWPDEEAPHCWPAGRGNVRVRWTAGYWLGTAVEGADEIPDDIQEAVCMCVADSFKRYRQRVGGEGQERIASEGFAGDRQLSHRDEWDDDWGMPAPAVATLMGYRDLL